MRAAESRLARGKTALDLLLRDKDGRLPQSTVRVIGRRVLTGLDSLHRAGMAHLDVEAPNVALMTEEPSSACLIDFGSCLELGAHCL